MAKSKKLDLITLILFGVLAVCVIMVIVGVCIAWTTANTAVGGKTVTITLSEWAEHIADAVKLSDEGLKGFSVMQAFAYITLVLTILTAIAYVVSKFVDIKVLKWVVVGVAALTVISAIVAIATSYSFCGTDGAKVVCLSKEVAPAAGAWLTAIFGIVGGAAGVFGALKK